MNNYRKVIIKIGSALVNDNSSHKENSIKNALSAKFQSIVLGSIVAGLGTDTEKVMLGLLKYGKSESDWSAPHYKAQ